MPAEYECLRCHSKYATEHPAGHVCPHCGHVYVKWVNYDEWRKDWRRRNPGTL